mgnify:CR=1 FL=1
MTTTDDINITLKCGHVIKYSAFDKPCPVCEERIHVFPQVEGQLKDEYHKVLIQIHSLFEKHQLNIDSALIVNDDGDLGIVISDKRKDIELKLRSEQVHKIHSELKKRFDDWIEIARRNKSVLKCIFDIDYYHKYFDSLDRLIPRWKIFIRKYKILIPIVKLVYAIVGSRFSF